LLLSNRTKQVFETDVGLAWKPSKGPLIGTSLEGPPDRAVGQLGMLVRLGISDVSAEPTRRSARHSSPPAAAA